MALSPEEARQHRAQSQRRWRQANPGYERAWREANPEKVRQQRTAERERRAAFDPQEREQFLRQKRESAQARLARQKEQEAHRQRDRDRSRAWAQAHPTQARERKQAWAEANRERVREQKLAYYYRHREERQYANRARSAARRQSPTGQAQDFLYRQNESERYKAHADARRADPEKRAAHNVYQNEWRRRERRRIQLDLPRRAAHRARTNEVLDDDRAAEAFFARPRSRAEKQGLGEELVEVRVAALTAEQATGASLAGLAARIREAMERPARLSAAVDRFLASPAGSRLREEVRMDVIARSARGIPAYLDLGAELRRRAHAVVENAGLPTAAAPRVRRPAAVLPLLEADTAGSAPVVIEAMGAGR